MKHQVTQNTIKLVALVIAASLILSVGMSASVHAEEKKDKKKDTKKDSKKEKKETKKETKKKEVKKTETKKAEEPASTTQVTTIDPMQEKLAECKTKKNQREQYECEKALKSSSGDATFKAKATKTTIGPITFYSAEATVEKSSGKDIVNLRFLVENTGSKDNITLYCTGPAVCNYDVSDGTTTYKYAAQDFTNGQIVLKPGASRTFNMLFGPAIGYGSYVDFKFDPSKQYVFNVKEPWGSGSIPLNLK
jgi:hypothetical protein